MKSVNKSIKINWVQKPRFVYKGTNRPLINNLSGSGLLKKAIFPSSLAFLRRGHCFFLLSLIFFRKIRVDLGRFPFSQNFRKFRLDRKWKTIVRFVPLENSRKSGKSKEVDPFSLNAEFRVPFTRFLYFIPVSIVTNSAAILVSHRVTGSAPFREQLFTCWEIHFCSH